MSSITIKYLQPFKERYKTRANLLLLVLQTSSVKAMTDLKIASNKIFFDDFGCKLPMHVNKNVKQRKDHNKVLWLKQSYQFQPFPL